MKSHATISWRTGRGRNACLGFALGLTLALTPSEAKSDGLVVRTNQTRGPFIVTIFTTPRISRDHPAEVNMMVQRRDSGEVMMDAEVNLSFVPPADAKPNPTRCSVVQPQVSLRRNQPTCRANRHPFEHHAPRWRTSFFMEPRSLCPPPGIGNCELRFGRGVTTSPSLARFPSECHPVR
jgi:hypothetical protein